MTPKQFFDDAGDAFPVTRLDDRTGIDDEVDADEQIEIMPAETFAAVQERAREGERLLNAGDHQGAFGAFVEALNLLPDPPEQWNAAGWLLVAMGENAIQAGSYETAEAPLSDAMNCPGTIGNPWVHLRLGQARYEVGKMDEAAGELARAYMGGGREVFEGQDPKYFALVETVLEPPPGMERLP